MYTLFEQVYILFLSRAQTLCHLLFIFTEHIFVTFLTNIFIYSYILEGETMFYRYRPSSHTFAVCMVYGVWCTSKVNIICDCFKVLYTYMA